MSDTELLPKSKTEAVRRLEVFTGAGRRRVWSTKEKDRIVAESYTCGGSVSGVARRHGLTPQQLFAWRRNARHPGGDDAGGPAFAPVIVDAGAACSGGTPLIEIVIGAATVRVAPRTDAVTLAAVLRAIKVAT
jgi:transposase